MISLSELNSLIATARNDTFNLPAINYTALIATALAKPQTEAQLLQTATSAQLISLLSQ